MKVKLTYPIPGYEHQVGHVIDADPKQVKKWIDNDWCFEIADEPKPKVKYEPKPKQER